MDGVVVPPVVVVEGGVPEGEDLVGVGPRPETLALVGDVELLVENEQP